MTTGSTVFKPFILLVFSLILGLAACGTLDIDLAEPGTTQGDLVTPSASDGTAGSENGLSLSGDIPGPTPLTPARGMVALVTYIHPEQGYQLDIPNGAIVEEEVSSMLFIRQDSKKYITLGVSVDINTNWAEWGVSTPEEFIQYVSAGTAESIFAVSLDNGNLVGAGTIVERDGRFGNDVCQKVIEQFAVFIVDEKAYSLSIMADAPGRCDVTQLPETELIIDSFRVLQEPVAAAEETTISPTPIDTPSVVEPIATPLAPVGTTSYYLIAPEDNGLSGPAVGCGDSAIQIASDWPIYGNLPTDIKASLENLFSIKTETLGQSGLIHSLYHANLYVEDVTLIENTIYIVLQGDVPLQGACADARSHAQILYTVFQYAGFDQVRITLNGQNLKQVFDSSGLVQPEDVYQRSDVLLPFELSANPEETILPTATPDVAADDAQGNMSSLSLEPVELTDPAWRQLGPGDTYTISWNATEGLYVRFCVAYPASSACFNEELPLQGSRTLTLRDSDPVADHWVDIYVEAVGSLQTDTEMLRLYPRCHNQWFDESLSTWCPSTAVTEKELLAQPFQNGWMVAHRGSEQISILHDTGLMMRVYNFLPDRDLTDIDLSVPTGYFQPNENFAALWVGLYGGSEDVQTLLGWPIGDAIIFTYRAQCERRPQPSNYNCFELGPDNRLRVFAPFGASPDPNNEGISTSQSPFFFIDDA